LLVGLKTRVKAVSAFGLLLCAFAGTMATMMFALLFSTWRIFSFFWPAALIVTGGMLLLLGLGRNIHPPRDAAPPAPSGSSPAQVSES
jgi:hypothetical protein